MNCIIYIQENGIPALISPAPEALSQSSILAIAERDVPAGMPFRIVAAADMPDAPQERWAWTSAGPLDVAPPSPADLIDIYRRAVQAHIDATAQARGYDSGVSAASYAGDPNAAWAAEAAAFIAWRSAVWVAVFDALADVQAGTADAPESPDALIATLPAMVWPA